MTSFYRSLAVIAIVLLVAGSLVASPPSRASGTRIDPNSPTKLANWRMIDRPDSRLPADPPPVPRAPTSSSPATAGLRPSASTNIKRPVGPFGGAADYDSGWVDVDPGETRVFRHDLGGSADDYVVDLSTVAVGFVTQAPFSQEGFGGDTFWDGDELVEHGYAWHSLDNSQIKVTMGPDDESSGPLRLRIWRVTDADYDSGWQDTPIFKTVLSHNLGGDPDDYVIYYEYRDLDGPLGVNRMAYGQDEYWPDGRNPYEQVGAAWAELDDQEISILRGREDTYADRSRLRIWRVPEADYDSGWQDIATANLIALDHDLGGPWNDYYVDVQLWDWNWERPHHRLYGLDRQKPREDQPLRQYGASLRYLTDSNVSIYRGDHDVEVRGVRVRIWANPKPKYDSGWVSIAQDQWLTLNHGLGGDPDFFHVDLRFKDTDADGDCCHGINQWALGGDSWTDADDNLQSIGAYWNQLTSDSIVVRRYPGDHKADKVRLRIWLAPAPEYGFAGKGAGQGTGGRYYHNLGGHADDYVVGVEAQHGDWLGLNTLSFGRDRTMADHTQGYQWNYLTDKELDVVFGGDSQMEYPHVRIWQNPHPAYDSGWRSLTPSDARVYQHGLDLHPNVQIVDLQFRGEQGGLGLNQAAYGRDWLYEPGKGVDSWGAMWYDLQRDRISVWRYEDDAFAAKGRLRIWSIGGCYAVETGVLPAASGAIEIDTAPNCGSGRGYGEGTVIEFRAEANQGYAFDHWTTEQGYDFDDNPQSFYIGGDTVLTAHFAVDAGPFPVLFDEAHAERNTLSWTRAKELSNTLPWHPDPEWVYFGKLRDALGDDFALVRNASQPLTDALLANYRALILAAPEEGLTPAEQQVLSRYVRHGGGVVFLGDCGLGMEDRDFWWNTFGFALNEACLFSPIPDQNGDFAVTDFHDQAPGGVEHYNTNWLASLEAAPGTQRLAWTDADTWEDSNGSDAYERKEDETGKFLVLAEHDGGCGRVVALSDDALQDGGFDDYDNAGLMRALLFRVTDGAPCPGGNEAYLPLLLR